MRGTDGASDQAAPQEVAVLVGVGDGNVTLVDGTVATQIMISVG